MTTSYVYQIIICIVFLLILFLISKLLTKNKLFFTKADSNQVIQIIEKQHVNKNASLLLVKIHDELLLLGSTEQQIHLIKKMDKKY